MKTRSVWSKLALLAMFALLLAGCGGDNSSSGNSTSGSSGNGSSSGGAASSATSSSGDTSGGNIFGNGSRGFNPSDLQVTATGSYSSSLANRYYYVGVVKNNGSATFRNIIVSLVNDSGNVLPNNVAQETTLQIVVLPPGKSAGFNINTNQAVNKPSFKFAAEIVNSTDMLQPANMSVSNDKFDPSGRELLGSVTNNSDKALAIWSVNVMSYDASGKLMSVNDVIGGNVPSAGFSAHGSVKFTSHLLPDDTDISNQPKVARYDLFASALQNP